MIRPARRLRKRFTVRPKIQEVGSPVSGGDALPGAELRPISGHQLTILSRWEFTNAHIEMYDAGYLGMRREHVERLIREFHAYVSSLGIRIKWEETWKDCDKWARWFITWLQQRNALRIQAGGEPLSLAIGPLNFTQELPTARGRHCLAVFIDERDRFVAAEPTPGYTELTRKLTGTEADSASKFAA